MISCFRFLHQACRAGVAVLFFSALLPAGPGDDAAALRTLEILAPADGHECRLSLKARSPGGDLACTIKCQG